MSDPHVPGRFDSELEAKFLESRTDALIDINLNSFWSTAIILMAFSLWDAFVDPGPLARRAQRSPRSARSSSSSSGLFQKLPGNARWLPRWPRPGS